MCGRRDKDIAEIGITLNKITPNRNFVMKSREEAVRGRGGGERAEVGIQSFFWNVSPGPRSSLQK